MSQLKLTLLLLTAVLSLGVWSWGRPTPVVEWSCLAAGLALTGIPHGAIDDRLFGGSTHRSRIKFQFFYALAVVAVVLVWLAVPVIALPFFLGLSAWHFGRTVDFPPRSTRRTGLQALAYGSLILTAPVLSAPTTCGELFSALMFTPELISASLLQSTAAAIFVVALAVLAPHLVRDFRASLSLGIQLSWLLIAPPILGFGVWFCLWHSLPEILDHAHQGLFAFYQEALLNTVLSLAGMAVVFFVLTLDQEWTVALNRVVFVGIAALTVPHMWVHRRSFRPTRTQTRLEPQPC